MVGMKSALLTALFALAAAVAVAQTTPAVYPQQEGYVDAHGVLIYYVAFGAGSPLVMAVPAPTTPTFCLTCSRWPAPTASSSSTSVVPAAPSAFRT